MKLLEPISIRNLQLDNRIILLATHLGYCEEDGIVTDRLVSFYRERARHRPGLIVVGGCYTEHRGSSGPTMIGISRDEHIEGLTRLTDAIHSFDVPVAAQLYHAGRYVHSIFLGEQAVSASEVLCRLTRETPRPLSVDEIHETTANFGKAAERAKNAGFDSVEIIGSAGYIINQFLAKATNKRDDDYGGSHRN
ncbi:MAG: NADH:flavin oxidoreductase, partial [Promethearchaeota archaeon]